MEYHRVAIEPIHLLYSTMDWAPHRQHYGNNFLNFALVEIHLVVVYEYGAFVHSNFGMEFQFLLHSFGPYNIDHWPCDNHLIQHNIDYLFIYCYLDKIKFLTCYIVWIHFGESNIRACWYFCTTIISWQ